MPTCLPETRLDLGGQRQAHHLAAQLCRMIGGNHHLDVVPRLRCGILRLRVIHNCTVGEFCTVGMNAVVSNDARLGDFVKVGEGAVVPRGKVLEEGDIAVGVPVKVIGKVPEEEREGRRAERGARKPVEYKEL